METTLSIVAIVISVISGGCPLYVSLDSQAGSEAGNA